MFGLTYAKETLEEELYNFWNKGLNIFTQSLIALEIPYRKSLITA